MYMSLQYIIVFSALAIAVFYIIYRINKTFNEAKSGCYGCKGCAIKQQMMKKRAPKGILGKKNECFQKKV